MLSESSSREDLEDNLAIQPDNLHPDFTEENADVVLAANGGNRLFRVHSIHLKKVSGFFRAMYTLPQSSAPTKIQTVYLDEDAETLDRLLCMVSGLPLPPIESYDMIDAILYAAEKYDMPGPPSIVRVLVMTPPFLEDPLRLYGVACRYGWDKEAKFASTRTLSYNLYDPSLRPALQRLSSNALLNLIILHRSRREGLRKCLDTQPFVSGSDATCIQCQAMIDYHTWRELKYKMILEMDARPQGDTILGAGLDHWPEAEACWRAVCPSANCRRFLYDKVETLRVIRDCIDALPQTI
ncbi:hypothetical protein BDQ12DRAFT_21473 [Crucibulum laeve]|uniref:BTB domain-containing protein n=1 Tax=Crucibulum laeve TaxID=68775 RepID=A0A5C3MT09_9AGAR|nr:hypothetical protein BDQ12DRAFT_21473 [Crucibulum laeve]